jgi:transposase
MPVSSWKDAVKAAGIDPHCHHIRATAATRFYLAGFSIREIAELMTWSEDRVERLIDRYAKRDRILRDRIRKVQKPSAAEALSDYRGGRI